MLYFNMPWPFSTWKLWLSTTSCFLYNYLRFISFLSLLIPVLLILYASLLSRLFTSFIVLLPFYISCECRTLQSHFPHYPPYKFQLYTSDSEQKLFPFCEKKYIFVDSKVRPCYSQYTVEPYISSNLFFICEQLVQHSMACNRTDTI